MNSNSLTNKKEEEETRAQSTYEVPAEGSLALLALGYRGLVAWRQKRKQLNYQMNQHLYIVSNKEKENG